MMGKMHALMIVATAFCLLLGSSCAPEVKDHLTICCAGDSIMRPVPYHLRSLLSGSKHEVEIKEWAQGGLTSESYKSFFARRFPNWKKTRSDFILLQLGTNDVFPLLERRYTLLQFKENMSSIIKEFKKFKGIKNKHPRILIASVPLFCFQIASPARNSLVENEINPAIQEIAQREKAIFVDNYSVLHNRCDLYDPDGVHPNREGERALARNWLFSIRRELR